MMALTMPAVIVLVVGGLRAYGATIPRCQRRIAVRGHLKGRKGLVMWYVVGGMIVASVGYALYRVLAGNKEKEFGKPESFLLRR